MPVHGPHSADIPGAWDDLVAAINQMLSDDPDRQREDWWQTDPDGSVWPKLSVLRTMSGRNRVYHSFRVAAMSKLNLLPEGYEWRM